MANAAVANKNTTDLSIHDERRKRVLINSLIRTRDDAVTARLYLTTNKRNPEEIMNVQLAIEHIEIALGHLGVEVDV